MSSICLGHSQNTRTSQRVEPSSKPPADVASQQPTSCTNADEQDNQHYGKRPQNKNNVDRVEESNQRGLDSDQRLQQTDESKTWSTTAMYIGDPEATKSDDDTSSVQLVTWAYETSDSKLVMAEMLEKRKWETEKCE